VSWTERMIREVVAIILVVMPFEVQITQRNVRIIRRLRQDWTWL